MSPEMLARLKEHARATVAAEVAAAKLRGLGALRVEGRQVSLTPVPVRADAAAAADTWVLVLWAGLLATDSITGPGSVVAFPEEAIRVTRPAGLVTNPSGFWQATQMRDTTVVTLTLEAVGHPALPATYDEAGIVEPGPVIVDLVEYEFGVPANVVATHEFEVLPGGSTVLFSGGAGATFTELRPTGVRRKRT